MSKHASGPWVITHSPLNGYRVSDKTGWGVATVLKDINDEANARLIAAAPQMLEALERLLAAAEDGLVTSSDLKMASDAIKAAKGEA